jgi:hypothetical protein
LNAQWLATICKQSVQAVEGINICINCYKVKNSKIDIVTLASLPNVCSFMAATLQTVTYHGPDLDT